MKKNLLMVITVLGIGGLTGVQAQRCGTTEYYKSKIQADQSVQQRIDEFEKISQDWISRQPVNQLQSERRYPELSGFVFSGNEAVDRANYANEKSNLILAHPHKNKKNDASGSRNITALRQQKQNANSFITIEGGQNR